MISYFHFSSASQISSVWTLYSIWFSQWNQNCNTSNICLCHLLFSQCFFWPKALRAEGEPEPLYALLARSLTRCQKLMILRCCKSEKIVHLIFFPAISVILAVFFFSLPFFSSTSQPEYSIKPLINTNGSNVLLCYWRELKYALRIAVCRTRNRKKANKQVGSEENVDKINLIDLCAVLFISVRRLI